LRGFSEALRAGLDVLAAQLFEQGRITIRHSNEFNKRPGPATGAFRGPHSWFL
jgi:hypothetical protein